MITETEERSKYERIWAQPAYRQHSPGEDLVPTFLEKCAWQQGDYIIDFGCGTGRAGLKLKAAGLEVMLVDITESCLDAKARILPFMTLNLWELPPLGATWIFCADCLEHIPEEHIEATLTGMANATINGGLLQIAMFEDACGQMIGETLHLTIKPKDWWMERINKYWEVKESCATPDERLVVILGKGL